MRETKHISLFELRNDLAGFFRMINEGQQFAVYQYSRPLAIVGKTGELADLKGGSEKKYGDEDVMRRVSDLFDIMGAARIEIEVHKREQLNKDGEDDIY